MATVRTVVTRAMKKLVALAIGREPPAAEAQDGLEVLQALYRELVGQGVFGRLQDVLMTDTSYDARENERIICKNAGAITITLPEQITTALVAGIQFSYPHGGTDYGRGGAAYDNLPRPPRDGACIVVADINSGFEKYYIYEANVARWVLLDDLTLDSVAPLTGRYENAIASMLAVRWALEYGMEPTPALRSQANGGRYALSMKMDRGYRPVEAAYF